MMNDFDPQAPVEQFGASPQAPDHNGSCSGPIRDIPSEQYTLDLRTSELDSVYQVLKDNLSRRQRHQCWKKWRSVLGRYPLFGRTPFLNIVNFANQIARENGFNNPQKIKFRSELLRSLVVNDAYGNRSPLSTEITLKNRSQKIRFKYSGLTKFEKALIGIDEKSNLVLMTKRRMVTGTPVRIQISKGQGDENTALRISGNVAHIEPLKSGFHFKYIIQVKNTDYTLAA